MVTMGVNDGCHNVVLSIISYYCSRRYYHYTQERRPSRMRQSQYCTDHFQTDLCDSGLRPGSVGGLHAPTNWMRSNLTHAWSDVR